MSGPRSENNSIPDEPPARPSGYWAIRGVAHNVGHHLGDLSAVALFGPGVESSAARASETAIYWYMSLLAGDVGAGSRDPRETLRRLPQIDPALRAIVDATQTGDMRMDELLMRDPLASWGRGRVTLLGDAAHPVLPHSGQGAAQALEDAVALGLVLAAPSDVEAALRRYEQVRFRRTRDIQRLGRRIARVTTTRSAVVAALRTTIVRLVPMAVLNLAGEAEPARSAPRAAPALTRYRLAKTAVLPDFSKLRMSYLSARPPSMPGEPDGMPGTARPAIFGFCLIICRMTSAGM